METLWPPPVLLSVEATAVMEAQEVTTVETLWLLLLLLSVSVAADSRRPLREVTDGGDGGEVADMMAAGTLWPPPLLLSVSMEAD